MRVAVALGLCLAACTTDTGTEPIHGEPDAASVPHPDAAAGTPMPDAAPQPIVDAGANAPDGHVVSGPRTVFVIPMENEPASKIYNNTTDAPYINSLIASAASTTMFQDELPTLVSEPHYIWMEAGINSFSDATFLTDDDPSASNSTSSTAHLATQLDTAHISWTSYQQGITTGTCPVASSGVYAAKHNPFVFFQDIAGSPPSTSSALCKAHHKAFTNLAADLTAGVSGYVFITGDLCHDMHGDASCTQGTAVAGNIKAGDAWLKTFVPSLIAYAQTHDAVIFITWDEGDSSNLMPFLALGHDIKPGSVTTAFNHGSMTKTIEEFLGVPVLPSVASFHDFSAMFQPGTFP